MTFTDKAPEIEDAMESIAGRRREDGHCVFETQSDPGHDLEFRDFLSRREYRISGMCQTCQDDVFEVHDDA
jgi:hypothetical protein